MSDTLEAALPGDVEQEETRKFYNTEAERYFLATYTAERLPGYIKKELFSDIKPGDIVLDLGCGYGVLVEDMPEGAQYIGVDFSSNLLEIARKYYPAADFRLGDICNLGSLVTEQCKYFIASMVFGHVARKNLPRVLSVLHRQLVPGAKGIIVTYFYERSVFLTSEDLEGVAPGQGLIQGGFSQETLEDYLFAYGFRTGHISEDHTQGIMYVPVYK